MNKLSYSIGDKIKDYCAHIGADPLLVQGPGGNVSWKEGNILWIKASGTWLAEACNHDIFVPVDWVSLREAMGSGDFSITPQLMSYSDLRPSIETLLHALMPQRIVVHLHATEILAHLVRKDCEYFLQSKLKNFSYVLIDYYKPGKELAYALSLALKEKKSVIFLKNHGVIIGGDNIDEIDQMLHFLIKALATEEYELDFNHVPQSPLPEYMPVDHNQNHRMAFKGYFEKLDTCWALYPDHVVFLGPRANTYDSWDFLKKDMFEEDGKTFKENSPEVIFVYNEGIFVKKSLNKAKLEQLLCYYHVMKKQDFKVDLVSLSQEQVSDLLSWDQEKYRTHLSFKKEKYE